MDPVLIMNIIALATGAVTKLTDYIVAMKKQIDTAIPDEELRLESYDDTVARMKAAGKIPQDWQPPAI